VTLEGDRKTTELKDVSNENVRAEDEFEKRHTHLVDLHKTLETETILKDKQEKRKKELITESIALKASIDFLRSHLDLDTDMANLNLEELNKVLASNQSVNSTISELVSRVDALKKFSRAF
jgi:hypothetical protein